MSVVAPSSSSIHNDLFRIGRVAGSRISIDAHRVLSPPTQLPDLVLHGVRADEFLRTWAVLIVANFEANQRSHVGIELRNAPREFDRRRRRRRSDATRRIRQRRQRFVRLTKRQVRRLTELVDRLSACQIRRVSCETIELEVVVERRANVNDGTVFAVRVAVVEFVAGYGTVAVERNRQTKMEAVLRGAKKNGNVRRPRRS